MKGWDLHGVIDETIAPTVTWRGKVIEPGQIIVKRSPVRPQGIDGGG